jgi:hypothetical protein
MATSRSEVAGTSDKRRARPLDDLPSDEEVAVVVSSFLAVLEGTALRRSVSAPKTTSPTWRFSGRWWAHPVVRRRERPWPSA